MKKIFLLLILSLVFCLKTENTYSQGPLDGYFKGKNTLDFVVSAGVQNANKYYLENNTLEIPRTLFTSGIFAQYGVTNYFDIIATIPFIDKNLQDGSLYAKFRLLNKNYTGRNFTLAAGVGASAPLSNYNTESSASIGQRATQFHGHLIMQSDIAGPVKLQVQGAYHYAVDPVPSNYTASAKIIYAPGTWYFDAWFEFQKSEGDIYYLGKPATSFREFAVEYNKVGGVIYKGLKNNYGVFVNYSKIISGKGTYNTALYMVGFNKKFEFSKNKEVK